MPSTNIKNANKYIAELQTKVLRYKKFNKEKIRQFFRKDQKDRKPPNEFVDSSFLYIRSYDGDIGERPFSGITFWKSPDITVAPVNDLSAYTKLLDAGTTYHFSCNVRNKGDLIVPSAKVEFFMCNPTLGFDTRFATKMGVSAGWVNPYATTKVGMNYTIPADTSGHKCLFARVFSFSPLDIPLDDFQLQPTLDRHVGQLNLNIVTQASSYTFNLVHLPNALDTIDLEPMTMEEVFATRHPLLADFKFNTKIMKKFVKEMKIGMSIKKDKNTHTKIRRKGNRIFFYSKNEKATPFTEQKIIKRGLLKMLKMKNKSKVHPMEIRQVLKLYREMNKQSEQLEFNLQIPDLGLAKGEATAMKIVATDRLFGIKKGGITLIITG